MSQKSNQLRKILLEGFHDRNEPFFYLAPDMINSVTNANMDMGKGVFVISFNTVDGRDMDLKVKNDSVNNWFDNEERGENEGMLDFVRAFVGSSQAEDDMEDGSLDEIVDEYGDIMGDDDMPKGDRHIGKSKFGSEKAIKQTIPKSKRYYGDLGLGVITW